MNKIYWCEGGLKLSYIATNNVSEPDITSRMRYIMVRLENWDITLVQEGWQNKGLVQEVYMTRLDWVEDLTQSVWNFCIKVWYMKRRFKTICSRKTMLFWMENSVEGKPCIYIKSESLDITI